MRTPLLILAMTIVSLVPGSSSKVNRSALIQPALANSIPPTPNVNTTYTVCGVASYYDLSGITANGETFNPAALTAAHRWFPFDAVVTVVDQTTGRTVKVRINDRGPWVDRHILDLTPAAINALDPKRTLDLRTVCIHW
jgi:rare lipoprotein A (peptidoglycan hydrolase)